ncbi:hypothetical protein EIQ13_14630 [Xanthomonas campestris pv. campestris]
MKSEGFAKPAGLARYGGSERCPHAAIIGLAQAPGRSVSQAPASMSQLNPKVGFVSLGCPKVS